MIVFFTKILQNLNFYTFPCSNSNFEKKIMHVKFNSKFSAITANIYVLYENRKDNISVEQNLNVSVTEGEMDFLELFFKYCP